MQVQPSPQCSPSHSRRSPRPAPHPPPAPLVLLLLDVQEPLQHLLAEDQGFHVPPEVHVVLELEQPPPSCTCKTSRFPDLAQLGMALPNPET